MYNIPPKRVSKTLRLLEIYVCSVLNSIANLYVCSVIKSIAKHKTVTKFTTVRGYKTH